MASWNVDSLGGKHQKYIVRDWLKTLKPIPLIIGIQELKTSFFLTFVTMNVIQPDYMRVISLPFEGKGGAALLFHPSLKLLDSGTMNRGREIWAQVQIETITISIAIIYAPGDSPRARAYIWHQLKTEIPYGQWIIMGNFNMVTTGIIWSLSVPLGSTT